MPSDKLGIGHIEERLAGAGAGVADDDIDLALGHVERLGLAFTLRRLRNVMRCFRKRRLTAPADQNFHPPRARERQRVPRPIPYSRR
jgi:hypothetical protein